MLFKLTENPYIAYPRTDLCEVDGFVYAKQEHKSEYYQITYKPNYPVENTNQVQIIPINDCVRHVEIKDHRYNGYKSCIYYNIHFGFQRVVLEENDEVDLDNDLEDYQNTELTLEQKIMQCLNNRTDNYCEFESYLQISEFYENIVELPEKVKFNAESASIAKIDDHNTIEMLYKCTYDCYPDIYYKEKDYDRLCYLYDDIYKYNSLIFKRLPNGYYRRIDYYLKNGCGVIGLKKNHHYSPVINYVFSTDFSYNHCIRLDEDSNKKAYKTIKKFCITKHFCIFSSFNNLPIAQFTKKSKKILIILLYVFKRYRMPKCIAEYILLFRQI